MQIAKNTVVTIHYTLKDDDGNIVDSSEGGQPLAYLHGVGNIISGLESALEGREEGEEISVTIPPERGYGPHHRELMQVVPRDRFDIDEEIQVGMQFKAQTTSGTHVVTVTQIDGNDVTIDGNHPLAGQTLNFDVAVQEVREASSEEIAHGEPVAASQSS